MNKLFTRRLGALDLSGIVRIMAIPAMWAMTGIHAVYADEAYQQVTTPLSLSVDNATLREVFNDIETQSTYVFIYSDEVAGMLSRRVSFKAEKEPVAKILDIALAGSGLTYKVYERQIMVSKQPPAMTGGNGKQSDEGALRVRGVVVDTKEPPQPLAGAAVTVQGTAVGTVTDENGFFSIKADRGDVLLVSFMGYVTKEIRVLSSVANMSIALEQDITTLEQVVVTGMTSQARNKVASAVGVIENSNFTNKPVTRLSQALQGGTTGIFVSQSSGMPGGDAAKIKIRGVASLLGSDPLILIDGFEADMDKLDPATVESISVLKDASAASMYGAKAGNGVIVITTKRGTAGRVSVGYNGYFGVQQPIYMPDFVDSATYMEYHNQASINGGASPVYSELAIQTARDGSDLINYPNTDWAKETMREISTMHEHNLNVSGGNTTARFALSAQYLKQNGIYKYMDNGFDRMAIRLNTTINLSKTLFTYVDAFINRDVQSYPTGGNRAELELIYKVPPTVVAKYPDKGDDYDYYGEYNQNWNPLMHLQKGNKMERFRDYTTINIRPVWNINSDLVLKGQFGYRLLSGLNRSSRPAYEMNNYFTETLIWDYALTYSVERVDRQSFWMANIALEYSKKLNGGHEFNVIGGWAQEYDMRNTWDVVSLMSYFVKGFYSYKNRYLLEASARYDGSSLFGPGNKWGLFPSVALGWNIHNENFMAGARNVELMKLRLSYGKLGNNQLGPYKYQSYLASNGSEESSGNPDLKWETVSIWNAGLDMSFFESKLDFTFDIFTKLTDNLLVNVPSTPSSGLKSTFINSGQARVNGIEVSVGYNHAFNSGTRLGLSVGYSYTKSELTKLYNVAGNKIVSGNNIYQQGQAMQEYYGYVANGLLSQTDLDNYYPIIGGYGGGSLAQHPGDIKYVDMNGDGVINDEDKVALGALDPSSIYYASLSFGWKNLDLEVQVNGVGSVPVFYTEFNANPLDVSEGGKPQKWHMDYWTEENPNAKQPRPTLSAGNNGLFSNFWRVNGAYLRVRYIQLGYTIPWVSKKMRADTFRIYANVQNPFTFTNVEMIDPETKGTYTTYPMFRTFSMGLNVRF